MVHCVEMALPQHGENGEMVEECPLLTVRSMPAATTCQSRDA